MVMVVVAMTVLLRQPRDLGFLLVIVLVVVRSVSAGLVSVMWWEIVEEGRELWSTRAARTGMGRS